MKTRTLLVLVAVALVAGAGLVVVRMASKPPADLGLGKRLLEGLDINAVESIAVSHAGASVHLARKEGRWTVRERFDYPADFDKIARFLRRLGDLKIGRTFAAGDGSLSRLALKSPDDPKAGPDEKGTLFVLRDQAEKPLAQLLAGKTRKREDAYGYPEGQYVMEARGKTVYLVDQHFEDLGKMPKDWLQKTLFDVPPADVVRVAAGGEAAAPPAYVLERPEKGKEFLPVAFPEGMKLKESEARKTAGALNPLVLEDVAGKDASAKETAGPWIEYRLFSGVVYRLFPFEDPEEKTCLVRVKVTYDAPAEEGPEKETEAGSDADSPGEQAERTMEGKTPEQWAREASELDGKVGPWTFVISKRLCESLATDPATLTEQAPSR